jgi:hypothetical protein
MIYLSGHILPLRAPRLGFIFTPPKCKRLPDDVLWAADNGRFSAPETYSDQRYLHWLERQDASRCLFAVAPDVLGDHESTVQLSLPMLHKIRTAGYKAAFVAQDGWREATTPWDDFDVLFLGGTTGFKLSCGTAIGAALGRGKSVHMGRVNSYRRLRVAAAMGCASADGTFLKFGPDVNAPRLLNWFASLQPMLPMSAEIHGQELRHPTHHQRGADQPEDPRCEMQ